MHSGNPTNSILCRVSCHRGGSVWPGEHPNWAVLAWSISGVIRIMAGVSMLVLEGFFIHWKVDRLGAKLSLFEEKLSHPHMTDHLDTMLCMLILGQDVDVTRRESAREVERTKRILFSKAVQRGAALRGN